MLNIDISVVYGHSFIKYLNILFKYYSFKGYGILTYYNDRYREIIDFSLSLIILGIAFSIRYMYIGVHYTIASFIAVIIGFLLHELAHRYIARFFGLFSIYRAWYLGLALTLIIAIATKGAIVFAAPGVVEIVMSWHSPRIEAIISSAGPITNIAIAVLCLAIDSIFPNNHLHQYINIIGYVNASLGFFNLLPVPPLDGYKIIRRDIFRWIIFFVISVLLIMLYG